MRRTYMTHSLSLFLSVAIELNSRNQQVEYQKKSTTKANYKRAKSPAQINYLLKYFFFLNKKVAIKYN